jgi:starch synthase (maltosyl-transferring)
MLSQKRVIIENVAPQLDGGLHYIKRVVGEKVDISADVFADGHDVVECSIRFKHEKDKIEGEVRMTPEANDVWTASFIVLKQGYYTYYIEGWVDHPLNWQHGIERKIEDGQHVNSELLEGRDYISKILPKVTADEKEYLERLLNWFKSSEDYDKAVEEAKSNTLREIFKKYPEKLLVNTSAEYKIYVDRSKARFSTWYEFFPRSASQVEGQHGTFSDCERLLPRIAGMGFDILYFPPVHPIGEVNRKGKNNATVAEEGDVGSPWGIGSRLGGHKAIHPQLGTLEDFKNLVARAEEHGIEVAMDFALQAAPDHPYVKEHPSWFKWRPDGTVQYAENPPKKYQDILPIYFESEDWEKLWEELLDIIMFWIEECGIRVFRVDNPHTKPFYFWGWLINKVKTSYPDVLFLSEAFTRPKVMQQLAKQGFTQSYTYFTWRNSAHELKEYLTELTKTDQKEYFRPNFWPNTPDINPYALQGANEVSYLQKYFLAATLSSNTGIYGPVFEQMVSEAVPGKEEYQNSEKYQIRHWDWDIENKLIKIIRKINEARKNHPSLQQTKNILFCETDNDKIMAYLKYDDDKTDYTIMVANLDSYYSCQGWIKVPIAELGIREGQQLHITDAVTGSSYVWDKEWCFVELHPTLPFHLFKIHK